MVLTFFPVSLFVCISNHHQQFSQRDAAKQAHIPHTAAWKAVHNPSDALLLPNFSGLAYLVMFSGHNGLNRLASLQ